MKPTIIDIGGIGPAAVAALAEHRIKSLASLARASIETVAAIPGFSEARAAKVIAAAAELLVASGTPATTDDKAGKKDKSGRKDKKNKGNGKGKGKGKKDRKNKNNKKGKK